MAIIKYSGIVEQIRGHLGGTVFSKYFDGFNAYKKGKPVRWGSTPQQRIRSTFAQAAYNWNNLSTNQRTEWAYIAANTPVTNRLGESSHLTPFAYYMKFSQLSYLATGAGYNNTDDSLEPAYALTVEIDDLEIEGSAPGQIVRSLVVDHEILTTSPQNNVFFYYLSLPVPREDSNYNRTYYFVGWKLIDDDAPPSTEFQESFTDIQMPPAFYSQTGAYHRLKVFAITVESAQFSPDTFANGPATFIPPVTPSLDITFANDTTGQAGMYWSDSSGGFAIVSAGAISCIAVGELPGVAADYSVTWSYDPTYQASSTPNPTIFDGSQVVYQNTMSAKFLSTNARISLISNAAFHTLINNNYPIPTSQSGRYSNVRVQVTRISDGAQSPIGYFTLQNQAF